MKLLDDGTSDCPSDQLPPKYPLWKFGGAVEDLNIFTYLRKLPAAIQSFSRAEIPPPLLPLTILQLEHIILIISSASLSVIKVYLVG